MKSVFGINCPFHEGKVRNAFYIIGGHFPVMECKEPVVNVTPHSKGIDKGAVPIEDNCFFVFE